MAKAPPVSSDTHPLATLSLELRRGALVLAVLSQLKQEQYGYSLKRSLNHQGLAVEEGTLYPLLRRLESQKLLSSRWRAKEGQRRRRYYVLSEEGRSALTYLKDSWTQLVATLDGLLA